ncbi:MAG TPA: Imm1 family immunity protein [Nostocaceae cyanobacterium]|nr:Imm1 family immunity protein [Nostocaceae cyanobacterium]
MSKSEEVEKLIVGGQGVNYPAKVCVDLQLCLKAAKTFTELGKLDSSLTWKNGDSLTTA